MDFDIMPGAPGTAKGREKAALRQVVLPLACALLAVYTVVGHVSAQIDPRQMAGIPRPDSAQPASSVSVRLIRGEMTNAITDHPVELIVDGTPKTVSTNEEGRAQFYNLPASSRLKAAATVDGERLESQEFQAPAPGQPGIRLLLVATDPSKDAQKAPAVPAIPGEVTIGGQSRIVIEPDDEDVRVFYLFDIINTATAPVDPPTLFMFDTPTEAQRTTLMEGSSPQATATGTRVRVQGPFPPGETFVQVGYVLPAPSGRAEITQRLPAKLEQLAVMVKKVAAEQRFTSPQVNRQQEMPAEGQTYIVAVGDREIEAAQPVEMTITGLPHHSRVPRWIALTIASGVGLVAVFVAWKPADPQTRANERKQLISRREKLFQELLRVELDHRRGKGDPARFASRREVLVAELEQVYGALDATAIGPEPASRAGLPA
jgi:hypothetical protein